MLRRDDIDRIPESVLISHYLAASYCYYWEDDPAMEDTAFDYLCVRLLNALPRIKHIHKRLVDEESLRAGTCLLPPRKYPARVVAGADYYRKACKDRTIMANYPPLVPRAVPPRRRIIRPAGKPSAPPARRRIIRGRSTT